jgi:hypothetical protein
MRQIVGTTQVHLPTRGQGRYMIQNLGPGKVAYDTEPTVTMTSGLILQVGDVVEMPLGSGSELGISLISDTANTDVRAIVNGV